MDLRVSSPAYDISTLGYVPYVEKLGMLLFYINDSIAAKFLAREYIIYDNV